MYKEKHCIQGYRSIHEQISMKSGQVSVHDSLVMHVPHRDIMTLDRLGYGLVAWVHGNGGQLVRG